MSWLGRSLGDFGSQLGEAHDINLDWKRREQELALNAARQKLSELMLPLQIQEIQARLKQMGQPKPEGLVNLPGGGTGGATYDAGTGKYALQPLVPGMDAAKVKMQIGNMAQNVQSKEAKATLAAYADSIDAGEDPQAALQKALAFMGTASTHSDVTARVHLGPYVPDKNSVSGVSRQMLDGAGNVVKTIPNVIAPGTTTHVMEGWEKTADEFGNEYLIPKTTVNRAVVPGVGGGGTPHASVGGRGGPQGTAETPSNMPPGARATGGHKNTPIQADAVKASKDARDAYNVLKVAEGDYRDAKAGNAKASLALVFSAVRSMVAGAGRMTNVEIEQELKAGSMPQRLERWYTQATEGTMPVDQMDQIMEVVKNSYEGKRQGGQQAWEYAYPGRPLQPWLRPSGEIPENAPPRSALPPPPPSNYVLDKPR